MATRALTLAGLLTATSAAWASIAPIPVSEPGSLGLLAAGVVAAIIGRRFYRKK